MGKHVLPPERAALAAQIEADRPATMAVEAARQKVERARHFLNEAEDRHRLAEQAATEARELVMSAGKTDGGEMRRLRRAAEDANEDAELARDALRRQQDALTDAEGAARYAVGRIEAAADKVLVAEAQRAFDAAQALGRRAASLAWVAIRLAQAGNAFNGERHNLTSEAEALNPSIMFGGRDLSAREAAQREAVAPWHAFHAALMTDAAAPMPEIG